jgi:hypothetical protein
MRLIDEILACEPNSFRDVASLGAVSALRKTIRELQQESPPLQYYEVSDEVVQACTSVFRSRPSSVLSALPYARLPYDFIWLERKFIPQYGKYVPNANKPAPHRVGCLLVDFTEPGNPPLSSCLASWAWSFPPPDSALHIAPFSILFNFHSAFKDGHDLTQKEIAHMRENPLARWHNYIDDPKEMGAIQDLCKHNTLVYSPFCLEFWKAVDDLIPTVSARNERLHSLIEDLAGEDVLVTGFLLMLNSRNALTRQPEDYSRLNKARARNNRPPLTPFIRTSLTLPKHLARNSNTHTLSLSDRSATRLHLVAGHYKVRKSGVFWWSPHPRGKGQPPTTRTQYSVRTPHPNPDPNPKG